MGSCFLPILPVSGGGAPTPPTGEATVWDPVMEWADLATIPGPLRDGDFCLVFDTDGGGSVGYAVYSDGASEWQLFLGIFDTVTLMLDFPEPVASGAQATASDNAYVWHTFDAADTPDGVERSEWLPPQIASRSPVLRQYATGAEADTTAVTAQGNTIGTSGTGAASMNSGFVRLNRSGASSGGAWLSPTGVSATTGLGYYVRALARATVAGGGSGYAGLLFLRDGANITLAGQPASSELGYMTATGSADAAEADEPRSALAGTSSDPEPVEIVDQGATRQSQIWRNGRLISALRRNANLTASPAFISGPIVSALSGNATLDVRQFIGVEFTP